MIMLHASMRVKADRVEDFKAISIANASHSLYESGVVRFDVYQNGEDPTIFMYVEVYHTEAAAVAHMESAHFRAWRQTVDDMIIEGDGGTFVSIFPEDEDWT